MVEIEECRLRALEQNFVAGFETFMHERNRVGDHRFDLGSVFVQKRVGNLVDVEPELVVDPSHHGVQLMQDDLELLAEDLFVEHVLHPQASTHRLVGVRRPDPAFGRAQLVLAQMPFLESVETLMVRKDEVCISAHPQLRRIDALRLEHGELFEQHTRIDDHTVADDRRDVVVQDTRWHELERETLTLDHDRVSCVVAALKANHRGHVLREQVCELAFAFVTPLGTDNDRCAHVRSPSSRKSDWLTLSARPQGPRSGRWCHTKRTSGV